MTTQEPVIGIDTFHKSGWSLNSSPGILLRANNSWPSGWIKSSKSRDNLSKRRRLTT